MNRLKRLAAVWLLLAALLAQWALAETKPEPTLPPFDASVPEYDPQKPEALTADQLYAESCILINQNTGEVLFEKNADMQMNPASCTKIMTLLRPATPTRWCASPRRRRRSPRTPPRSRWRSGKK